MSTKSSIALLNSPLPEWLNKTSKTLHLERSFWYKQGTGLKWEPFTFKHLIIVTKYMIRLTIPQQKDVVWTSLPKTFYYHTDDLRCDEEEQWDRTLPWGWLPVHYKTWWSRQLYRNVSIFDYICTLQYLVSRKRNTKAKMHPSKVSSSDFLFKFHLKTLKKPKMSNCTNHRYVNQMCFEVGDFMFEMTTNFSRAVTEYNEAYKNLSEHLQDYRNRWQKLSHTYYQ